MANVLFQLLNLFLVDAVFLVILALALMPLARFRKPAFAVLRRNFIGYFSNPTGYVFLCIFVLLTSLAAFWPHEFFVANLANLDQLNRWLPMIMVVFIPAITMSIWAEERRQGTDELLLTLPANDFDIVIGKYLAAAAIFTVSLLFSQMSNFGVLVAMTEGNLDTGLLFTTYLGYWFVGLAMLAIGMVASFLTNNLTVGFVLGAVFNIPLVFSRFADLIIENYDIAHAISFWSLGSQFEAFGRGVVSLTAIVFFLMVVAIGIYLSMVLIGSRHWFGGRDGSSLLGHYVVRAVALVAIAVAINAILARYDVFRFDATEAKISSLSEGTKNIIRNLKKDRPIFIDAFVSSRVPERYVKTRYDLLSMLKEFQALAQSGIELRIHDNLETSSDEAKRAEEQFGITPQVVEVAEQGAFKQQEVLLGAAFRSGLEKVVVPFFDYGIPVEYEIVRSVATVAESNQRRKRVGVVDTDVQLLGGFTMNGMQPQSTPKQKIMDELQKQYDVDKVNLRDPVDVGRFDVLIVAQPSSLDDQSISKLVELIKKGQPTAIFEDPLPMFFPSCVGTDQPKRPQGMFGQPPAPKGDIRPLWSALGISPEGDKQSGPVTVDMVFQQYNPYKKAPFGPELVFVRQEAPGCENAFSPNESAVAKLEEVLFPSPGGILNTRARSDLEFSSLCETGKEKSGKVSAQVVVDAQRGSRPNELQRELNRFSQKKYTLAAKIQGRPGSVEAESETSGGKKSVEGGGDGASEDNASSGKSSSSTESKPIKCIYVSDVDFLHNVFVDFRARPDFNISTIDLQVNFDNVTFFLNLIDDLAGETRFLDIRTRKFKHGTLKAVERLTDAADSAKQDAIESTEKKSEEELVKFGASKNERLKEFRTVVEDLRKKQQEGVEVDFNEFKDRVNSLQVREQIENQKEAVYKERLDLERRRDIRRIEQEKDRQVSKIQNQFKFWALALPPIPPILLGVVVFVWRRLREREGISKARRV